MASLRSTDLREVITLVGEMNDVEGDEPFPSELLGRLVDVVPADGAFFNERNLVTRELVAASGWCVDDDDTSGADEEWDDDPSGVDAWDYVLNHPVNVYRRRTGYMGALADSDFYGRGARLRHDVFASDYHVFWRIVDSIGIRASQSSTHTASLWIESNERDFTERDRSVLDALQPHFSARYRHARLQRLLANALAALAASSQRADALAVVLVGRDGRVEFASSAALELLGAYFGETGASLPRPLDEWRRAGLQEPFNARRGAQRLIADAVGAGRSAIVLHEEPALGVMLTAREWEVMRWVEAGKKNDEIAELLWITPSTVKKHLEHVYAKLGVRTRTGALARLSPRLAAGSELDAATASTKL